MEKLKTRNEYVGCNRKCRYYADKEEAYSYGHWCFVKRINGKLVFNDYNYSHTTRRHQNAVKSLLRELGVKIDLYVYMHSSLSEETFKTNALDAYYDNIVRFIVQNNTKRVRKKTIESNNRTIERWKKEMAELKAAGAEYTFSQVYKAFRRYKERRDEKQALISFVKDNKGKVYQDKNSKEYFQIMRKVGDDRVKLFALANDVPRWRKEREIYFSRLLKDYSHSPLYSAMM